MSEEVIAKSTAEATVKAPAQAIDLTEWEDLAERGRCRLVSLSDSMGPDINSRTQVVVIWEFAVEPIDAMTTRLINTVEVREAPGCREALEKRGVPFAKASEAAQQAVSAHNAEETPLFARDIERKAAAYRW